MKNLIFVVLSVVLVVASCSKTNKEILSPAKDQELLSQYFSAASVGVISTSSNLKYVLLNPIDDDISEEALQKVIKISPSVPGKVSLANNTILTYTPDEPFGSNKTYTVTLNLKQLDEQRFEENITYQFKTMIQSLSVSRAGMLIGEDGSQTYLLRAKTADKADAEKVLSCISSDADSKTISDAGSNEYIVELVWNQGTKTTSNIQYNGKPIGSNVSRSIDLYDLGKDQFKVLDNFYNASKKEYNIYFTQLLNKQMDMTGLIMVNDQQAEYTLKGNLLTIFLANVGNQNTLKIELDKGIKSQQGRALKSNETFVVDTRVEIPEIQFVSTGTYFPSSGDFKIPVKTRALDKMRLVVIEIKPENVKQYLAWESLDYTDYYNLRKFGKPIYDEIVLLNNGIKDNDGWVVHGIDMSQKVKRSPGSIYHIAMEFSPEFTTLACKDKLSKYKISGDIPDMEFFKFRDRYYRDYYYYYDDYDYWDGDDPCKISFYSNRSATQGLFICSDYSIIAKKAGNTYHMALTRLDDLSQVANASVSIYNLQGERIDEKTTDANGFAVFDKIYEDVTVVEVKHHNQITYLALDPYKSNSLTEFDISGERSEEETEFFIYSDRDVYRPGDSIYVNLMVNKSVLDLPKGLPITMSFYNLDNMIIDKQTQTLNLDHRLIYSFMLHTQPQAKTGVYRCVFEIGPKKLRQNIRIETIKPNTTEVVYTFNDESEKVVYGDVLSGKIHARYLTGYDLAGAKINADAKVSKLKAPFQGFNNYTFDIFSENQPTNITVFDLITDAKGRGSFQSDVSFKTYNTPVKLYMETETSLPNGGVSKEGRSITVSPFKSYIGAAKRNGSAWQGNYNVLENVILDLVSLNNKGSLNSISTTIEYTIQQAVDSWWVDKYRYRSYGNYIASGSWKNFKTGKTSVTGKGSLDLGGFNEGAYLITLFDSRSGHSSQVYFNVYDAKNPIPGTQPYIIEFETEKEVYKTGEKVTLMMPAIKNGKALISIERGSTILEKKWVKLSDKKSMIDLTTDESWAPNVYVHVTVVQKYMQDNNDMPLRMYGIKYLRMDATRQPLTPVTDLPDVLESNKKYTFHVSEKENRPMEYTIALVDEGLLGLTGFKTPNPDKNFNGKFPLLVKTWDIYQLLISWFNGTFAGIISIGGDDVYNPDALAEISRFKPVVMHFGPFKLDAKGKNSHTITIPNYIGKLRLMVVAASPDNFGNLEKQVPVKNPLMVQSQLPRSLNVTDKVKIPVSVFKDDKSISTVNLTTKVDAAAIKGIAATTSLNFNGKDQLTHLLNMEIQNKVGPIKIEIGAQSGSKSMVESTEMLINYPHAYESEGKKHIIDKDKNTTIKIAPKGYTEVFSADLIISGVKVPDFTKYAEDLIQYPYGCLEQITSRGYAMMYLDKILSLDPKEEKERQKQLQHVLFEISKLQQNNGKFKYWENGYYDGWSDVFVGNFLVEMNKLNNLGMYREMMDKWLTAQVSMANDWALSQVSSSYLYEKESLIQAFRLYTLAKAGKSAKSGLNRFVNNNESKNPLTWWLIAGSYQLGGFDTKAKEYMQRAETLQMEDDTNDWTNYNFGSQARNLAMIIEVLSDMQPGQKKIDDYYDAMVEACNRSSWASTQTMGFAFIAAYKYFGKSLEVNKEVKYTITGLSGGNKTFQHSSFDPKLIKLSSSDLNKNIQIKNQGSGQLFVYQNSRFIDNNPEKSEKSDGLMLHITYYNSTNKSTGLNNINLGDDIEITVLVENQMPTELTHLALNYKVPSGWELMNTRLYETESDLNSKAGIQYQDFRDDRVYTFFELKAGGRKSITFKAKAAFSGDFYLPAVSCHHMYRGDLFATSATGRVKVK
ncbi:MAG: hypothetical protein LC107_05110 [Chitinophagales bacterium]|nr:hypothetical protein [Chitinophagales bacterium]